MTARLRRNRGAAMVVALAVLSLLVTTVAVLTVATGLQAKRARVLAEDAQLRGLLNAGVEVARSELKAGELKAGAIPVPDVLRDQGAALTLQIEPESSSDTKTLEIEASLPKHRMSQRVHFTLRAGAWEVSGADLGN